MHRSMVRTRPLALLVGVALLVGLAAAPATAVARNAGAPQVDSALFFASDGLRQDLVAGVRGPRCAAGLQTSSRREARRRAAAS